MDLTQLFKATVNTVRLRNKSVPDKSKLLKTKSRDEFTIKANDVRSQVKQLRDLLIENRAAYMRFGYHLKTSSQMTDEERDIIDLESEKIISICNQYVNDLKSDCIKAKGHSNKQFIHHKLAILDILSEFLKDTFGIHKQQKECRIQHELDTFKLLKLESHTKPRSKDGTDFISHNGDKRTHNDELEVGDSKTFLRHRKGNKQQEDHSKRSLNTSQSEVAIDEDQANKFALEDENLSTDDVQMFESENVQLLNDLKGLSDEVEQIEKNVIDIARLQEIFTEKVSVQKHDIERIGNVVVGATENIKDANEQIKQAIKRNAGLRVWVLFFLIVMSFTLLFLDWYND